MRGHTDKRIAALAIFALILVTCGVLAGLSNVGAAGQSGASGKGLGSDAKPIIIESRPDKDVRVNSGWKLFLVGTNEYDNLGEQYDLHYAVKDVQSLKSQFMALGVPEENIVILTSQRGRSRSNQRNILRSFDKFVSGLTRNDSAFVYLSGHGFQFEGDERAYYAPADIDPDNIRDTGVSIDDMQKQLAQSDAKLKWMTVDACRNDPVKDSKVASRDFPSGVTSACIVNPSDLPDAFVFMQGCGKGQCSHESLDLEQGLLTYSLLEALKCDDNPAERNESGELEFVELINYVQKRTQELARRRRDDSNTPLEQKPRITCAQLPSFTLLTNLRRGGLTPLQRQEIADFDNYLDNNDFARAQDALVTIAGFFPEGTGSEKYKELKKRLDYAREINVIRTRANGFFQSAQDALKEKNYSGALVFIDRAIKLIDLPEFRLFREDLSVHVTAAIEQAISKRDVQTAESLNELLAKLDADAAKAKEAEIAALKLKPSNDSGSSSGEQQQQVLRASDTKAGDTKTLEIAGVKVNFHWAPAGTFMMGSPEDETVDVLGEMKHLDWEIQHKVELTEGFWIAETETTQELWQAVMGKNPSAFKGDNLPVETIGSNDCRDFVEMLNMSNSDALKSAGLQDYKYAMPTEAQWEYACRAGTTTPYNFGSVLNGDKANCDGNYPYGTDTKGTYTEKTTPVKSYAPNAWGLYDMHGNVWEWCADWYGRDYYTNSEAGKDPVGPSSGPSRVLRGGSWGGDAKYCRSAYRHNLDSPIGGNYFFGFRLVLVHDSQSQESQTTGSSTMQKPSLKQTQTTPSTTVREYPNGDEPKETRKAGALKTLTIAGVKVNFHWAPAGTFMMGSPESEHGRFRGNREKQHTVELAQGFWIAETETTQELWEAVMGNNPSGFTGANQLPVERVSWNDCQEFVKELNSKYSNELPSGYKYAMPTEAQWEYACRAGTTTPFSFGSTLNGDKANCDGNYPYGTDTLGTYKETPMPVKSYDPNNWGLYDMHGNVWEYCAGWFDEDFASSSAGKPNSVPNRVVRGGSWNSDSRRCRSAFRGRGGSEYTFSNTGFRLVLVR